jgi:hypothetical protein
MGINPIDIKQKDSCPYLNPSLKDIEPILIANGINNLSSNHLYEEEKNDVNQEKIIEENFIHNYSEYSAEENKIKVNNKYKQENQFHNQNTDSTTQDKKNIEKNQVTKETNNTNKNKFKITIEKKDENEFSNKGRRRKDKLYPNEDEKKVVHGKFGVDNIIQKVKIHFLSEAREYVNSEYKMYFQKRYPNGKYQELIKMTERNYENYLNNENKKAFLLIKLSDILSGKVSNRYSKELDKENYNKINIEKLIEEGEPKHLVDFINKTVEDAYEIYIREEEDKIPEFNFENDLNKIQDEKNEKGESYKAKYKNIAKEFLKIINNK